jgi:serine protease Do
MNRNDVAPAAKARRKVTLVSSVAAIALLAIAGVEAGGPLQSLPAYAKAAEAPLQGSAIGATAAMAPVSFADLVEKVKPAVVSVKVTMAEQSVRPMADSEDGDEMPSPGMPFRGLPFGPRGEAPRQFGEALGSGFFVSADGYVVTNNHVVDKAKTVSVTTDDGKTYSAKVVGTDPKTDLALLKIDGRSDFPFVKLAANSPRVGDWVLAVGNPFGLGGTVTAGIVSARGRDIGSGPYDDYLQIDAPVNRGNSGGPTFDLNGNVVGVNTAIYSPSGGSVGIAFDIPAQTVRSVVEQLKETGSVTRGYIGVEIQKVTPDLADGLGLKEAKGALVAGVSADGPAAKAGLKSGDTILAVNGQDVADAHELSRDIAALKPGEKASLSVWRDGETRTVEITIAKLPGEKLASAKPDGEEKATGPHLGLSLAPAGGEEKGGKGLAITGIDPASPAAESGLRQGDVITSASGKTVSTAEDVRKAVAEAKRQGRKTVLLQIERDGNNVYVAVPFMG